MPDPMLDLAFPIVEGRVTTIDHGHALYGAVKAAAPHLAEMRIGIMPLRGQPIEGGLLLLRPRERLRVRLPAGAIPLALPLAGRDLRVGSQLLRLGVPSIDALVPQANLYARTVVVVKGQGGAKPATATAPAQRANRPATEAETIAAIQAIAGTGASVRSLRRRTIRIHDVQIPGFEIVVEGLADAASLRLQAEGVGGRRAFGCGIFVHAGLKKPAIAAPATATSEEAGHA